jgi:hypothetical protein
LAAPLVGHTARVARQDPPLFDQRQSWMPTRASLSLVAAVLVLAAAGCVAGLAFGDPEDQRAELVYTVFLGVSLAGLAGVTLAAGLRVRAIREATHELLASDKLTQTRTDDPWFRERYELLIGLGAYREAELVLQALKR